MIEIKDIQNERIDTFLMKKLEISRSKIQKLIKDENILVNNFPTKNSYTLKENDVITVLETEDEEITDLIAEDIPLDIVYEDNDVIVINKQNGLVVHPAIGNTHNTLANGLLYHFSKLSKKNTIRPGIVHRIDAYTTGLLMVAKNDKAHDILAKQLQDKTVHRKYIALVWGVIQNDTGTINAPVGRDLKDRKKMAVVKDGKDAVTHFKVLERYENATLIELQLETGRTHQIRVHMNYIGYPVVNDPVYGRRKLMNDLGQCLHAKELGFVHPTTNKYLEFNSDLPQKMLDIIEKFKN